MTLLFLIVSIMINIVSLFFMIRFIFMVLKFEDQINDSLDVLDESYKSLSDILNTPVMFDDPQIKRAVKELKKSRDAIILVANKMSTNLKQLDKTAD